MAVARAIPVGEIAVVNAAIVVVAATVAVAVVWAPAGAVERFGCAVSVAASVETTMTYSDLIASLRAIESA